MNKDASLSAIDAGIFARARTYSDIIVMETALGRAVCNHGAE